MRKLRSVDFMMHESLISIVFSLDIHCNPTFIHSEINTSQFSRAFGPQTSKIEKSPIWQRQKLKISQFPNLAEPKSNSSDLYSSGTSTDSMLLCVIYYINNHLNPNGKSWTQSFTYTALSIHYNHIYPSCMLSFHMQHTIWSYIYLY